MGPGHGWVRGWVDYDGDAIFDISKAILSLYVCLVNCYTMNVDFRHSFQKA
jgi:hypothetical protein